MALNMAQYFLVYSYIIVQREGHHNLTDTFNFSWQQPDWEHFINNIAVYTGLMQQIISVEWYYKLEVSHHEIMKSLL